MKIAKRIINGIITQPLMFRIYSNDARSHHSAKAPLSHINILAGLILYRRNANNVATTIVMTVVAIYV
jgi:hypothetical protein